MDKAAFYEFLNAHTLGVLSTVSADNKPEAAVVGFGQTQNLELVFGTSDQSRKYQNLLANAHVAFVVGGDNKQTVQYEGIARELSPDELQFVQDNYWYKVPSARSHHEDPNERYFVVTPQWVRYADYRTKESVHSVLTF